MSHWWSQNSPETWSVFQKYVPSFKIRAMEPEMSRQVTIALYVVAMAAVIVGVDFAFFRNRFFCPTGR